MPFSVTIDSRQAVSFSNDTPFQKGTIQVTGSSGAWTFSYRPFAASGAPSATTQLNVQSFNAIVIPDGIVVQLDASVASLKSFIGGQVNAIASPIGEDLSRYALAVDRIVLADGVSYQLTREQALISQIGPTGSPGNLRSSSGNSKITVSATSGGDLTPIKLDTANDTIVLKEGASYTLALEQALIAKVGAGAIGDLKLAGPLLIRATDSANLVDSVQLRVDPTDTIELAVGKDYTLSPEQLSCAVRVGPTGVTRDLTSAGTVIVKPGTLVSDLTTIPRTLGIDAYELAAKGAYTLTASQLATAYTKAADGAIQRDFGKLTVYAGPQTDLTRLPIKAVDPKTADVLILDAGVDYRLTSEQARNAAKVGASGTVGDFSSAGQITVVAGMTANNVGVSRTEDLTTFASRGVDYYELAPQADYVLTYAQAAVARVGSTGALGDLRTAGSVSINVTQTADLTVPPVGGRSILGADEYRLSPTATNGPTYTLTAEQALKARVGTGAVGDVSAATATIIAGSMNDLTGIRIGPNNDTFVLNAGTDYAMTCLQATRAKVVGVDTLGAVAKAGTVTIKADPAGEDLTTALSKVTGYEQIQLTAGAKYALTSAQAAISRVISYSGASSQGWGTAFDNIPNLDLSITASTPPTVRAGISGTVYVQLAGTTSGQSSVPSYSVAKATYVRQGTLGNDWNEWNTGRDITQFVTITPPSNNASGTLTIKISANAGLANADATLTATLPSGSTWSAVQNPGIAIGLQGPVNGSGTMSGMGDLTSAGAVTIIANPTFEDLTLLNLAGANGSPIQGISAIQLAPGVDYKMTPAQALLARVSASGIAGDLTFLPPPGTGTTPKITGRITIDATQIAGTSFDFTKLRLDAGDVIVLSPDKSYTLSVNQALLARLVTETSTGAIGSASGSGVVTVIADATTSNTDIWKIQLDSSDVLQLADNLDYTISTSQLAQVRMGVTPGVTQGANSLVKARTVTVVAAPGGESLSNITIAGIDVFQLTSGPSVNYTLRSDQAARVGTTNALNDFTKTTGLITVEALVSAGTAPIDLSNLNLKSSDRLVLQPGSRYVLTTSEARNNAVVKSGATFAAQGDLTALGSVTVTASGSAEILADTLANVKGITRIELNPTLAYTLSDAQARIAAYGKDGALGNLRQPSVPSGILTLRAGDVADLTDLQTDANDKIILKAGNAYTLTYDQALTSQVGDSGKAGSLQQSGPSNPTITVIAGKGADLQRLLLDSNDLIVLTATEKYTLTAAQARIAKVGSTGSFGDFSTAGAVRIVADPSDDLTGAQTGTTPVRVNADDTIVLTQNNNYVLTPSQAAVAMLGADGVKGNLVWTNIASSAKAPQAASTGVITIRAGSTPNSPIDLSGLVLDGNDVIQLDPGQDYILTSGQTAISRVGVDGVMGQLRTAGKITVIADPRGEDLTKSPAPALPSPGVYPAFGSVSGIDGQGDALVLAKGKDYTLSKEQLSVAKVETGLIGDLTQAGVITLTTATVPSQGTVITQDNLATVGWVNGVDRVFLKPGVNYILTDEQASLARWDGRGAGTPPQGAIRNLIGPETVTIVSNDQGADLSAIQTDANDFIWLRGIYSYTLNSAQVSRVTLDGQTLSTDAHSGTWTLKASVTGENLTSVNTSAIDMIQLTAARDYTLTPEQARISTLGSVVPSAGATDLSKAGVITVVANAAGDPGLAAKLANVAGIDEIRLADGKAYSLTPIQAAMAKFVYPNSSGASASTAGSLVNAAVITLDASGGAAADLSGIQTDGNDFVRLSTATNYVLNSAQVPRITVDGSTISTAPTTGIWTLRASANGENLTSVNTSAIDMIQLTAARDYTLTPEQARISTLGSVVPSAGATDLSKAGVITVVASPGGDTSLASKLVQVVGVDEIRLTDGRSYTLTPSQAAVAKFGAAGVPGNLVNSGFVTIDASAGPADLSGLQTDSNDLIRLSASANYTLNSSQVSRVTLDGSTTSFTPTSGTWTLKASQSGENLAVVNTSAMDAIQLAVGRDYTLRLDQPKISAVGADQVGNLTNAGAVTVRMTDSQNLTDLFNVVPATQQSAARYEPTVKGVDTLQVLTGDKGVWVATSGVTPSSYWNTSPAIVTLRAGITNLLNVITDPQQRAPVTFLGNAAGSSGNTGQNTLVDQPGEWSFINGNSTYTLSSGSATGQDLLYFWDGTGPRVVSLIGVASITADGSSTLKVTFD